MRYVTSAVAVLVVGLLGADASSVAAAPAPPPTFGLSRCVTALQEKTRTVIGTSGNDQLTGLARDDVFDGGAGDDTLVGLGGDDCLYGITGADVIFGGDGDDALVGNAGDDQLVGGGGRDSLFGNSGDDRLWGGERTRGSRDAASCLDGGDGNDLLVADGASGGSCARRNRGAVSSLSGGRGNDRLYARNFTPDFVSCGPGRDIAVVDRIDKVYGNGSDRCERVIRRDVRRPSRPSLGEELSTPGKRNTALSLALAQRYKPILNGFRDDYPPTAFEIIGAKGYNDSDTCGKGDDDDRYTQLSDKGGTEMVNLYRGGDGAATLDALGAEAALEGNKPERYIDLPCGRERNDQRLIFRAGFGAVGRTPTIYTEVAPDRRTGGVAVSYWYWFTFNPGPPSAVLGRGEHEGDWEHTTVYVSRRGVPREVFYATHNKGQRRRWTPERQNPASGAGLVSRQGTHPIGFVALGSHATFPDCVSTREPGPTPNDVGCPPPVRDELGVPRRNVQYGVADTALRTFGPWVCWRGRVGEQTALDQRTAGVNSPEMPYRQDEVVRDGRIADPAQNCERPAGPSGARARAAGPARTQSRAAGRGGLPIPLARRTAGPLAALRSCSGSAPGPERGGTVISLCSPELIAASTEDGLQAPAAARRAQPRLLGRTLSGELDGRPVRATLAGPASSLNGVLAGHLARGTVRTQIDVVSWAGGDPTRALQGTLRLRLPRRARVVAENGRIAVRAGGRTLASTALRSVAVVEDP